MNLPARLSVIACLTADTFRQSIASSILWVMLAVTTLCVAVCLSIQVVGDATIHRPGENADFLPYNQAVEPQKANSSGVDVVSGRLVIAFGAMDIPITRDGYDAVRYIQLTLAGLIADTAGILLTLVWTAAFLPGFLERSAASVLLTKPVSRQQLLFGKFAGVLLFVFVQATLFTGGTWLALGARTGIWDTSYLLAIPLLILHFAIFFSFSVLLAVCTRSTIVCVLGSIAFWTLCWGMNFGRHAVVAAPLLSPETTYSAAVYWLAEVGYWILPKPADLGVILFEALDAGSFFQATSALEVVREQGMFYPLLSVTSSLAAMAFFLFASSEQLTATDY